MTLRSALRFALLAAAPALVLPAGPAVADVTPGVWEFEIVAGLYDPEPDLLEADPLIGARLVKILSRRFAVEGEVSLYDSVFDITSVTPTERSTYDATFIEVSGVVHFFPERRVVPLVLGGVGGAFVSASTPTESGGVIGIVGPSSGLGDDSLTVHSGAAVKIRLTPKLYLRPDVRARAIDAREFDTIDLQFTLSVGFGTVGW